MKKSSLKGKLKIDPSVTPPHKKELFSNLNYLEIVAMAIGAGILVLLLLNIGGREFNNTDSTDDPHVEISTSSSEEESEPVSLEDLRSQPAVRALSPEESQQRFDALSELRNQQIINQ